MMINNNLPPNYGAMDDYDASPPPKYEEIFGEEESPSNETRTIEMPFRNNENHLWWDPYNRRVVQVNSFTTLGMYEKRGIEREKIV